METKTKVLLAGGAAALAALAVFGTGAWFVMTQGVPVTGNLRAAVDEMTEGEEYEPTSVWIEEGVNPDVTTFGFAGKDVPEPTGPELFEGEIHNLVISKQNDLMACYAKALEQADVQGAVAFQFGIAPDGHVAMVKVVDSALESPEAEDCMVEQARRWSFPPTNRASLMKFDTDFTFVYE